uniref:Transmembrane protein n=1 Tax=Lacunastrum gracillimum TaxID=427913 RepID=A0A2U8GH64_9CHLO|nr:hypothetical protein [Lacunastrum gracillimum]AWI68046.1 hypothetical protein [Lacunastrum gracillimum]
MGRSKLPKSREPVNTTLGFLIISEFGFANFTPFFLGPLFLCGFVLLLLILGLLTSLHSVLRTQFAFPSALCICFFTLGSPLLCFQFGFAEALASSLREGAKSRGRSEEPKRKQRSASSHLLRRFVPSSALRIRFAKVKEQKDECEEARRVRRTEANRNECEKPFLALVFALLRGARN